MPMNVDLSALHWIYLVFIVLIIGFMVKRRDTSLICIIGIFVLAIVATGDLTSSISGVFNSFIYAISELLSTILIISIIPVIPIAAFFYLGDSGFTQIIVIIPETSQGIVNDLGVPLAAAVPLTKEIAAITLTALGAITGLDGSGFSGIFLSPVGRQSIRDGQLEAVQLP